MADWEDDDDLTETDSYDNNPLLGVSHLGTDDEMVLDLQDDGERVDTRFGAAVAFDATLVETDGRPTDDDDVAIGEGDDVRFMTDSSRLLPHLAAADLPGEVRIIREGVSYDTEYSVIEE